VALVTLGAFRRPPDVRSGNIWPVAMTEGSVPWWTRLWDDRPGAVEVLLGKERIGAVLARSIGYWGCSVSLSAAAYFTLARHRVGGLHTGVLLPLIAGALLAGIGLIVRGDAATKRLDAVVMVLGLVGLYVGMWEVGPAYVDLAPVVALAITTAWLSFNRRLVLLMDVGFLIGYAVLLTNRGNGIGLARWLLFTGGVVATSGILLWLCSLIERLAEEERRAREDLAVAHGELAQLNAQLEEVVDQQGVEIGGLQGLRQFLAPQVADAVVQRGIGSLAPHRARVAVVFCDLRGFTAFSSSTEPEEVMETLEAYYTLVGRALQDRGATVGSFAGDGIMAYFGDPVPCDDPAGDAVGMALDLRGPLADLVGGWRRRGFDLGCGIGIAFGYATIGPVGFEGRTDYTALGTTVNLAARLCGTAADGEILIDGRAYEIVRDRVVSEQRQIELRGFTAPVTVQNVTGWSTTSPS
jgi:class 3 adenylate cyclase